MKRLIIAIIMIVGLLLSKNQLKAQDTLSAKGIAFTPISKTAPATKATGTNHDGGRSLSAGKPEANNALKKTAEKQTLWAIFLAGMAGGFAALLMPCIFPMLPLTVSYFTKHNHKKSAIRKSLIYGFSIIVIYVVLGLAVTISFGADALNSLSTNGVFNLGFFLLIVAFAASFLGAFELNLPGKWVNAMDQQADKGGMLGLFFMAATLSLVSFSCTGPIIGFLLVQAATSGALLGPAIGMLGFALALAIPFTLFAMFPSWMNALPKSGGWLNSVKVTLGFLELALSLKFLSNVDLAYHWHWFDREIFLALWIVIFALMSFYLLGKLTFCHDSPLRYISVPRLFLAIIVLSFTMYMIPGLWGAPLRSISAFLPPLATQDFDLSARGMNSGDNRKSSNEEADTKPHKYAALFDKPRGFNPYFDYDEGIAYAKKMHKPVLIDFTGHACVNCRKMEANVWPDGQVYRRISRDYVLIQLYVDDKTDLEAAEQSVTPEGRSIKTIGNKWSYLQTSKFMANSQPFYVLLNPDTLEPLMAPQGAEYDPAAYLRYLDSGLKAYELVKP